MPFAMPIPPTPGSGTGGSGAKLAFTSPAGASNNLNPGGAWPAIGRLLVTLTANANWTGLAAGSDGQVVEVQVVAGAAFTLTLNSQNAGSAAANQFFGVGDLVLPLGAIATLIYSTGTGWSMK